MEIEKQDSLDINIDNEIDTEKINDFIDSLNDKELECARERIITRQDNLNPEVKKWIHSLLDINASVK